MRFVLLSLLALILASGAQANHTYSRQAEVTFGVTAVGGHGAHFWRQKALNRTRQVRRLQSVTREKRRSQLAQVYHAMKLASVIWGVPVRDQRKVGRCESGLNRLARNGPYRGIFQEGGMFEAGPFGRAGFSVFDTYANVFMAAYTASRQGWRQWACKP